MRIAAQKKQPKEQVAELDYKLNPKRADAKLRKF
jgi:hypothetical protein